MYDQPLPQNILFYMLYAAVAMTAIIASCYLLLRRGNAFAPDKYATGGSVLVCCHANDDGSYAISVTNEGPVIPAVDAERIFNPFVRLSSDEHSLGIGLPLARRLATSMGYNVTLDLEYTNGARFVVTGI